MRTWGRVGAVWTEVSTDASGLNDYVYLTDLIQCLKLNLNEDPLFANYGIPAQRSVLTQVIPDFYTYQTTALFAQFFAALTVRKVNSPTPTYDITAVLHSGVVVQESIPA